MDKMNQLKVEALQDTKFRGHVMGDWISHNYYTETIQFCHCLKCDMQVVINTKPLPNKINVSGEAVALTCKY